MLRCQKLVVGISLFMLVVFFVSSSWAKDIWISSFEIAQLPMSGPAWDSLLSDADKSASPDLGDQDDKSDTYTFAKALVYARTKKSDYADEVVAALQQVVETKSSSWDWLAVCRSFTAYAIAGDLISLSSYNPEFDVKWRNFLSDVRTFVVEGGRGSIVSSHEKRPNNYGTHAGASRIAIDLYLGDTNDLASAVNIFRGWLGDRSVYSGFSYGDDLSWQADPDNPVGINPMGATKSGHSIDGVLPDDQRRCGSFQWPPCKTNYAWEGLQGVLAQAVMLHRAGYDVWNWQDKAILRAVKWLTNENDYPAEGDDTWQIYLINYYYGTDFSVPMPSSPGKSVGFTDWTHAYPLTENAKPYPPQDFTIE